MYNKITTLLAGVCLISLGISFKKHGWHHLYDFPIPQSTAILVIIVGFLVILFALFQKTKLNKPENQFLICPQCLTPFDQKAVPSEQCPICKVNLEKLEGFYERHPELKEKNQKIKKSTTITGR